MNNNKGQALVEFIIILPIFLLLLISIIDFGNIITKKYSLENDIDIVSKMYQDKKYSQINDYLSSKDIKISYSKENDLTIINLDKELTIISPVLNLVIGKDYHITVEKSIYEDE